MSTSDPRVGSADIRGASPEIRVDPLTGLKTIVAGDRAPAPAPASWSAPRGADRPGRDPFLEGHEDQTPPEVYAVRPGGGAPDTPGWTVRGGAEPLSGARPRRAPSPSRTANPDLFTAQPARGAHEVIVNAPDPVSSLSDLDRGAGGDRDGGVARAHARARGGAPAVHLIVNERREAGASLPHTHAQLYALGFVPAAIARERERFGAYATRTMGGNLLGDLVQEEVRRRDRIVAIDDEAVLMAPWASQRPVPAHARAAPQRGALRGRRPARRRLLHDALSRLRAPARRDARR